MTSPNSENIFSKILNSKFYFRTGAYRHKKTFIFETISTTILFAGLGWGFGMSLGLANMIQKIKEDVDRDKQLEKEKADSSIAGYFKSKQT